MSRRHVSRDGDQIRMLGPVDGLEQARELLHFIDLPLGSIYVECKLVSVDESAAAMITSPPVSSGHEMVQTSPARQLGRELSGSRLMITSTGRAWSSGHEATMTLGDEWVVWANHVEKARLHGPPGARLQLAVRAVTSGAETVELTLRGPGSPATQVQFEALDGHWYVVDDLVTPELERLLAEESSAPLRTAKLLLLVIPTILRR